MRTYPDNARRNPPPSVEAADAAGLQREVREHEPHIALFAGPTGLEFYQRFIAEAARVLRPGRWLIAELGFAGIPRVLVAQLAP